MGFRTGLGAVLGGLRFILRTPSTWPWALVPIAVCLVIASTLVGLSLGLIPGWIRGTLPNAGSGFAALGVEALVVTATTVATLVSVLVSVLIAPPLSGPAMDHLVTLRERALGLPARAPVGVVAEVVSALKAQALILAATLPVLGVLAIVSIVAPVAAPATLPAKYTVVCLAVAWSLLDYPLSLRGRPARDRLATVRRHPAAVAGFGTGFALLFAIPCAGLVLLPAGVVGVTELLHDLGELEGASLGNR